MADDPHRHKEFLIADLRTDRSRRTERAIIDAATALFLRDGYAATSLDAVARAAGVAPRTLYLRFATKVALFQRVVAREIVGDEDPEQLPERAWSQDAFTARTLEERIEAFAHGVSAMHERLGPLMAVNAEVEASEPEVQISAQAYRRQTLTFLEDFWRSADRDGILPAASDLEWLITTSTLLFAAETRLLATRTMGWSLDPYHAWVVTTLWNLVRGGSNDSGHPNDPAPASESSAGP